MRGALEALCLGHGFMDWGPLGAPPLARVVVDLGVDMDSWIGTGWWLASFAGLNSWAFGELRGMGR